VSTSGARTSSWSRSASAQVSAAWPPGAEPNAPGASGSRPSVRHNGPWPTPQPSNAGPRFRAPSPIERFPKDLALAAFEDLDPPLQRRLLDELRGEGVAELVAGLDPDDRASLLEELPAGVSARLLAGLDENERSMTTRLLGYPSPSVGRRMTPSDAA
jgi:hypothetical protein